MRWNNVLLNLLLFAVAGLDHDHFFPFQNDLAGVAVLHFADILAFAVLHRDEGFVLALGVVGRQPCRKFQNVIGDVPGIGIADNDMRSGDVARM